MMNPTLPSQRDQLIIEEALHALYQKTGIQGAIKPLSVSGNKYCADAELTLNVDSAVLTYLVECKANIDRKLQIRQIRQQLDEVKENRPFPSGDNLRRNGQELRGLLIAPHISREMAEYCRECDLEFIDLSGNAYLRAPGIFVFITGEKSERNQYLAEMPKLQGNSAAGQRVALALLCRPALAGATFKEIATVAGVSVGAAHKVMENLILRSYVVKDQSVRRRLIQAERLFDEWILNYPGSLRATLVKRRFTATDPDWWDSADIQQFGGVWGGEVAAERLTAYLKPETQTIYVPSLMLDMSTKAMANRFRLRADTEGKIEIIEKFWGDELYPNADTAPPIVVYSELKALLDPRVDELAKRFKEKWIDPLFTQA